MYSKPAMGVLLAIVVAGCATPRNVSEQLEAQSDRLAALEHQLEQISETLAEMETGEEIRGEHNEMAASAFDLAVAHYLVSTAGFHDIEEALTQSGEIDPTTLPTVIRVRQIVSATEWPHELDESAAHFVEMLDRFQHALEDDDATNATTLAAEVHDHGHELSGLIGAWLSGDGASHDEDGHG